MSGFLGVVVSDSWLESQIPQVELRNLESKVSNIFYIVCPYDYNIEKRVIIGLLSELHLKPLTFICSFF